ncbi:MAG: hypothetical protein HQL84_03220 [Magnetococcales bacterium]|nr:hypothetical protein [Magnetococcales bacterium]MBF0149037.1 hypothetical protein [Magnetococcales bacterium]MBF0172086.1 hypothetical protein [Magnetococcales bacterium]MBF0346198.1 hypothetical protein [Magnetococcales bacterium]MBF0630309.1 hypothetical protein [Magnetococcales bacterium]
MADDHPFTNASDPPGDEAGLHLHLEWARRILGLGTTVTQAEFKERVHELLQTWHPDHALEQKGHHGELTQHILKARDIINQYIEHYHISFTNEEIDKYLPPREWFKKRFGDHS